MNIRMVGGALALSVCFAAYAEMDTIRNEHPHVGKTAYSAPANAVESWKDDRMGLFIHWDPGSQEGHETSWARRNPKVDDEHYDNLYKTFNPVKYDPDAIVDMAYAAGARYVVMIAKHHAGFSMFDSNATEFDMMSTPYGKDVLKMMEQACRRKGMKFGIYYSPVDWYRTSYGTDRQEAEYNGFYVEQLTELLTNYGDIHSVWFDGTYGGKWGDTLEQVAKLIRTKQPNALVNDRSGVKGDYYTTEHSVGPRNTEVTWETCQTTSYGTWGYISNTSSGKPFPYLLELAVYTWGRNGNFLLNLGPSGEGIFTDSGKNTWEKLGQWMSVHGEAVHGTRAGPYQDGDWGASTLRDDTVYLYVYTWDENGKRSFPQLKGLKPVGIRLLGGERVSVEKSNSGFTLQKPVDAQKGLPSVYAVKYNGPVSAAEAVSVQQEVEIASAENPGGTDPAALFDLDSSTNWKVPDDASVLEVTFEKPVSLVSYGAERGVTWTPKTAWSISIPDGNGGWTAVETNFPIPHVANKGLWSVNKGAPIQRFKEPVLTDRIRFTFQGSGKRDLFGLRFFERGK